MKLEILGVGARGASGLSAVQVAMSARARQFEPSGSPFRDRSGRAIGLGRCAAIPESLGGLTRLVELAAPAAREALAGSRRAIPIILALPDAARPDARDPSLGDALIAAIAARCPDHVDPGASRVIRAGHAGFAIALELGRRALYDGAPEVLVGGVDTHHDAAVLAWLEERGWLHLDERPGGRLPSEAAAFVRLGFRRPRRGERARCVLAGLEHESTPGAEGASSSALMSKLLRRVAESTRAGRIEWLLTDLNGEPERAARWLETEHQASDVLEGVVSSQLVEHTGDLGAATGAVLAVIACVLARTGAVPARSCVLALAADGPERAAIALDLPDPGGPFRASVELPVRRDVTRWRRRGPAPNALERAELARLARGCLEDIGSMSLLLSPGEATPDRDPKLPAQRLLDNLDALAALALPSPGAVSSSELLEWIRSYGAEMDPPGKARRFAVAFALAHLVRAAVTPVREVAVRGWNR